MLQDDTHAVRVPTTIAKQRWSKIFYCIFLNFTLEFYISNLVSYCNNLHFPYLISITHTSPLHSLCAISYIMHNNRSEFVWGMFMIGFVVRAGVNHF